MKKKLVIISILLFLIPLQSMASSNLIISTNPDDAAKINEVIYSDGEYESSIDDSIVIDFNNKYKLTNMEKMVGGNTSFSEVYLCSTSEENSAECAQVDGKFKCWLRGDFARSEIPIEYEVNFKYKKYTPGNLLGGPIENDSFIITIKCPDGQNFNNGICTIFNGVTINPGLRANICSENESFLDGACVCNEGFERNEEGFCVVINECGANEELVDNNCVCEAGFERNTLGNCIIVSTLPPPSKSCAEDEVLDEEKNICVPMEFNESGEGSCNLSKNSGYNGLILLALSFPLFIMRKIAMKHDLGE